MRRLSLHNLSECHTKQQFNKILWLNRSRSGPSSYGPCFENKWLPIAARVKYLMHKLIILNITALVHNREN